MNSLRAILSLFIIIISSGCYRGINGKVIDNATGKPLEGALVVVQWTRPDIHSIEGWSIEVIKNSEVLTDKEGVFTIKYTPMNPFANPPNMIIYKEGYIPWANDSIFPGKMKSVHEWKNNMTYKLDLFTNNFTARQLEEFLRIVHGGNELPIFNKIQNEVSRRADTEMRTKQNVEWLNDFKTVLNSLDKGAYTYDDIRNRLLNKDIYEINWLVDELKNKKSVASKVMNDNGVTVNHLTEDSNGNKIYFYSSIIFTKR